MKTKRTVSICIILVFFSIVWFWQNQSLQNIELLAAAHLNEHDIVILMNNSAFGYSSMQAYSLFYPMLFVLFLNHFFFPDGLVSFTRKLSRNSIAYHRVYQICLAAFLFSFTLTLVNIVGMNIVINQVLLHEMRFHHIAFLNAISLFFFYVSVGLLFDCVKNVTNSINVSFFIVVLFLGSLFFLEKLVFNEGWGPLKELVVFNKMLEREWNEKDVFFSYARQVYMLLFLFMLSLFTFQKREFLK